MKKILLTFSGTGFSQGAFHFAEQLNKANPILLIGVFIPQLSYTNLWSYTTAMSAPTLVPLEDDSEGINKNIMHFEELCRQHNIAYKVHKDYYNFALPELKKETRFADLLIIGSETFYENIGKEDASDFLKDALHASECPVIIVPEKFIFPQINLLAYDGSESSVYSIKQFAYLFPELCSHETIMVFSETESDSRFPDEGRIKELARQHFSQINFLKLEVNPKKYFTSWATDNKNAILVSGSFGRSFFSRLFRRSFVSDIITQQKLPVFVAHK